MKSENGISLKAIVVGWFVANFVYAILLVFFFIIAGITLVALGTNIEQIAERLSSSIN